MTGEPTQPRAKRSWDDLGPRLASGLTMVALGLVMIWLGGHWFHVFAALIAGGMVWELVHMAVPNVSGAKWQMAGIACLAMLLAVYLPVSAALPLLLAPGMVALSIVPHRRTITITFTALILLSAYGMVQLRDGYGMIWLLWLVVTVVVTDVLGYFAGRLIGGPKFWPRVSPKKTWAGTIAGWLGAGVVGLIFGLWTGAGMELIGFSIAASMASQMGDMAESAIKRKVGVKDSSSLIPGHGGLMDRFDGMLGASLFLLLAGSVAGFPPGL
ncbi:phosphatidate cytidylyltransferase [Pseudooceanicola nanhaiensis]|uniref:phosphatidate cytidylyltransferase n=1 Tax=Pseudooceanicola nanhaiensis TaxID=375761 RepID=UPI001CD64C39|nr:phosphatidate cytidylyltransferase [Pseudooceanicola nanhaiensis]MCA0919740.1 phosphatidate cytidylyltransferase [Pseudooceanicola nanhaiensis]